MVLLGGSARSKGPSEQPKLNGELPTYTYDQHQR
jgi:hypothetical protein